MEFKVFNVSFISLSPKLTNYFGKRALLAPFVIKSYIAVRDKDTHFNLLDFMFNISILDIVHRIVSQKPEVIFLSTSVWNINKIRQISCILKTKVNTPIVVGGPAISYLEDAEFFIDAEFDLIVIGEGEDAICRIIDKYKTGNEDFSDIPNVVFKSNGKLVRTPTQTVDISQHNYSLVIEDIDEYSRICYETSRGCQWKCKFCLWSRGDSKVRFYPIEKIKKDLKAIFRARELKVLEIVDADIFMDESRALVILKHIKFLNDKRNLNGLNRVFLLLETNPQFISNQIIDELTLHDRIIDCGLQSIDENINKQLGRKYDQNIYFKQLHKLANLKSDRCSEFMLEIIYGLPNDNLAGFLKTIEFILYIPYEINFWSFHFLVIPGTYFFNKSDELKISFNKEPPYNVTCNTTWSITDLRVARRFSFYFFVIQFCFPEIYRLVCHSFCGDKLKMFIKIFNLFDNKYEELGLL